MFLEIEIKKSKHSSLMKRIFSLSKFGDIEDMIEIKIFQVINSPNVDRHTWDTLTGW